MSTERLKRLATAGFFLAYVLWQALYPALSYVDPRFRWFAWNMYTGRTESARFVVVYADGSTETLPPLTQRSAPARVHSGSMQQSRFVPPHLCRHWPGAREVRAIYPVSGRQRAFPCRSNTP